MNTTFYIKRNDSDIVHYGVLGMKWGIRKYQNKDGSYTREGLRRFNASENRYNEAKKAYELNKTSASAKELRASKKQLKKDYKQLKLDVRADKGKDLYAKGITAYEIDNSVSNKVSKVLQGTSGILFATYLHSSGYKIAYGESFLDSVRIKVGNTRIPLSQAVLVGGLITGASSAGINMYNRNKKKQLRAYYGHHRD